MPFLEVIIAPKLGYVRYHTKCDSDPVEFDSVEGKFNNVHCLSIYFYEVNKIAVDSLFRAFPGVRQAELAVFNLNTSFIEDPLEWRAPVGQWQNLETVILRYANELWLYIALWWLRRRQELGQPRLRVRLTELRLRVSGDLEGPYFLEMCNMLRRYCDLELLEHGFSKLAGSPMQLASSLAYMQRIN